MFAASAEPQIDIFDSYCYKKVATVPVRDPIIGPIKAALRPSSGQIVLVGATARRGCDRDAAEYVYDKLPVALGSAQISRTGIRDDFTTRARLDCRARAFGGHMLRFTTAGESHGPALVSILEGVPAGIPLVAADINAELARRQQGYGRGRRMQIEQDAVEFLSRSARR